MHPDELEKLAIVVRLTLGILAVIFVVQFMLKSTLTEEFRQKIFAVRREAMLLVGDRLLSADEPAYVMFCKTCNGLLRYAERLTLGRFIMSVVIISDDSNPLTSAIDAIGNPTAKKKMRALHLRMGMAIVRHTMTASTGGMLISSIFLLAWVIGKGRAFIRRLSGRVESDAATLNA